MSETFRSAVLSLAEAGEADWLTEHRNAGTASFRSAALPSRRVEQFRYNNFNPLFSRALSLAGAGDESAAAALIAERPDLGGSRLVFVDGRYSAALSVRREAAGLAVVPFSEADAAQRALIAERLGRRARGEGRPFVALADAFADDGLSLSVERNARIDAPVEVFYLRTVSGAAAPRLLVDIGEGAEAGLVEHYLATPGCDAVDSAVAEIDVGANAELHHARIALGEAGAHQIATSAAHQSTDSRYRAYVLCTGGAMNRLDLIVDVQGQGCDSTLYGAYLARGEEQVDIHLSVEHAVPNCNSQETFRGMAAERGKAVFNGRIQIHRDAQKTDAQLSCRNLLLSRQAELDAKPELEIYADDVKCAHGATVGQLDPDSLFYLQSRGVPEDRARALLSYGFVNEVLQAIPWEPLAEHLRGPLDAFFAGQDNA